MDSLINSCVSRIGQHLFGLIYTALPSGVKNEGPKKLKQPKLFIMLHSYKNQKGDAATLYMQLINILTAHGI